MDVISPPDSLAPWPPRHTAEEMAEHLRKEIRDYNELLVEVQVRRGRSSARFRTQLDALSPDQDRAPIMAEWSQTNARHTEEEERVRTQLTVVRSLLQWLTGELWS